MLPTSRTTRAVKEVSNDLCQSCCIAVAVANFTDQSLQPQQRLTYAEYEDASGTAMLGQVQATVTQWKRPGELLSSTAAVPALVTSSSDLGSSNTRASSARLFAGHRSLEWLRACFASIQQLSVRAMHLHPATVWQHIQVAG